MERESDGQLVARVLAGDADAYSGLVARYRDRYVRYAARMLDSHADADEVLQSAFLRAYRKLPDCRDPERFGGWLRQIVVNETRTFAIRRGRRQSRFVTPAALDAVAVPAHGGGFDPALREEIQRALQQLVPDQREAFLLRYVEDLSYEEMAEVTGAGLSALKMRVSRACARLRELLQGVHHG